MVPCEVLECIEFTLYLVYLLLQDVSTSFRRDADVALVKIYAARHRLKVPHTFECLTIVLKSSFTVL